MEQRAAHRTRGPRGHMPLLVLAALALLVGCERRSPVAPPPAGERAAAAATTTDPASVGGSAAPAASTPAAAAAPASASAGSEPAAGAPRSPAGAEEEGVGRACRTDRSCPGYLRCQQDACAIPPALHGDGPPNGPAVVFDIGSGRQAVFRVELAIEEFEQMRGLMFRPTMDPRWGMIFLYDHDENHSFWMRNTYIPLDMVFLAADGTVAGVVEQAEPLTLDSRTCGRPSRHVLELVAGTVHRLGIHAGTVYRLVDFPPGWTTPDGRR